MKNLLLLILFLKIHFQVLPQRVDQQAPDFSQFINDTVTLPRIGHYYLIEISKDEMAPRSIVRKVSSDQAIIKWQQDNDPLLGKKYYTLQDSWKLSSGISAGKLSIKDEHLFSIRVATYTGIQFLAQYPELEVIRIIDNAQIVIVKTSLGYIENELIKNDKIIYVDLAEREVVEESPIRQYNPGLNRINYAKHNYPQLKGDGMIISLKEHAIFEGDIDLISKVILDENSSNEFTQHAKEMGTLIAGLGNSFQTGEGVVPKASLACTNFSSLFAEDESYYNHYNIKIQNHSYGTGIENYYGNEAISYDQISVDQPELIHVFSVGNMGDQAPEDGVYSGIEGFANLTGTYKQAKNVLVIGTLDSAGNYVNRSSSGPAYDGRIKPELSAFGGEGSSESAALASGCVAMIQHHYKNINGTNPSSSLIKSLLIAGSDDVHTPGIDFKTGYGSINLNRSLELLDSGWYFEGVINANDSYSFQLDIPENVAELKVVISWIDPPANPEDAKALVNDLDMILESPANDIIHPWVLNTFSDTKALSAPSIRMEDHINNTELISVDNPISGMYSLGISSGQLMGSEQVFSVTYHISFIDTFTWTFPTRSDRLLAGTFPYFGWDCSYANQSGILSIKYGNGSWETIGQTAIDIRFYKFALNDTSIYAQLKMNISDKEYLSDTFTITRLAEISVENDCDETLILAWDKIENTDTYLLYELQGDQLIQILSVTDTLVKLDKAKNEGPYYAVEPVQSNTLKGLRSFALNYKNNNKGCYLANFLVYLDPDKYANIELSINVPHEIQLIAIYKEHQGIHELLAEFPPEGKSIFEFADHDLAPGRFAYTAELLLNDGNTIYSDTLSFYYTDEKTVIVFPNPTFDDFIQILNDYPGGMLHLVDERGAFVRKFELVNSIEDVDLTGLRQGTYIFRIFYKGQMVNSGKIMRL